MTWRRWLGGRPPTPQAEARRLQGRALRLTRGGRAAFAAACAQRLITAAPHESLAEASRLLDDVWASLVGEPHGLTAARVQALSDRILRDNDPAFETAYDAALAAVVHAARAALSGHRRFAPWASECALNAAAARDQQAHELARQARDLRALHSLLSWPAVIAQLREA